MKLEVSLKDSLEIVTVETLLGSSYIINEIVQQGKHAYYHLAGISHKRIQREDINSDTFFDNLSVYIKEN